MDTQKLNVKSVQSAIPVIVSYTLDDSEEIEQLIAYVDFHGGTVYLPHNPEYNTESMRAAVLAVFQQSEPDVPVIPQAILDEIEQVRAGGYGTQFGQDFVSFNKGE